MTREHLRQHLLDLLDALLGDQPFADEEDPFLSDLILWKDNRYAVVEISIQIDSRDVTRAATRAETRRPGVVATPVVIGEEWTGTNAHDLANEQGVQWKVGDDLSPGFIDFRRLVPFSQSPPGN